MMTILEGYDYQIILNGKLMSQTYKEERGHHGYEYYQTVYEEWYRGLGQISRKNKRPKKMLFLFETSDSREEKNLTLEEMVLAIPGVDPSRVLDKRALFDILGGKIIASLKDQGKGKHPVEWYFYFNNKKFLVEADLLMRGLITERDGQVVMSVAS